MWNITECKSKIKIYAYVFSNTEDCLEYAQEVSGNYYEDIYIKNNGKMSWSYYKSVSLFRLYQSEKLIVFSEEKAYVIKAKISYGTTSNKNSNYCLIYNLNISWRAIVLHGG